MFNYLISKPIRAAWLWALLLSFSSRPLWAKAPESGLLRVIALGDAAASSALSSLMQELERRTNIEAAPTPLVLSLHDLGMAAHALMTHPLMYWSSAAQAPTLTEAQEAALRRYLRAGGMLLIDAQSDAFLESAKQALTHLFPSSKLEVIAEDHAIYKSYYLTRSHGGRTLKYPHLEGIELDGRYAVIVSGNDLGGAWSRDALGRFDHEVTPGGEIQREMAFRLGVNWVMYALCLDYKSDQIHIPSILKKRR